MKKVQHGNLLLAGTLTILVVAVAIGSNGFVHEERASTPRLQADKLDLGDLWRAATYSHTVVVRNPTRATVHVSDIRTSCSCTSVNPSDFELQPGQSAHVKLTFDLNRIPVDPASGQFGLGMAPIVAGAALPEWMLRGRLIDPIRARQRQVAWEEALEFGSDYPVASVDFETHPSVSAVGVRCDSPDFKVRVVEKGVNQHVLEAYPQPTLPPGAFQAQAIMKALDKDGSVCGEPLRVPFVGTVECDIRFEPDILILGAVSIGESETGIVSFQSRSGTPFQLKSYVSTCPTTKMHLVPDIEGSAAALVVTQPVVAPGEHRAQCSVLIDTSKHTDPLQIRIPIVFYGKQ